MSLIPKIEYGSLFATVINFDYPPVDDDGDKLTAKTVESTSQSGLKQIKLDYIEATREITFYFLSEALVAQLQTFFVSYAALGKPFRIYTDKDEADYAVYELDKFDLAKKKITSVGASSFIYSLKIAVRRTINANGELDIKETMSANILNNQVTPISIPGLDFTGSTSGRISYEIRRSTDSSELEAIGQIGLLYKVTGWEIDENYFGDDVGVTFSITPGGALQYISTNMAGTNYSGLIYFRELKFNV